LASSVHEGMDARASRSSFRSPESPPPQFIIHFSATNDSPAAQLAFMDARRLGRIRLCTSPTAEPPISNLGFDPMLCMPTLGEFSTRLLKRGCTIKSLLLDQSFSAGIGNWLADEILYHSKVHPEQPANLLDNDAIKAIWENITYVCQTAVACNADHNLFPDHWLFPHRWVCSICDPLLGSFVCYREKARQLKPH
jgi:formamidopyrimidine-DNA glycosylase